MSPALPGRSAATAHVEAADALVARALAGDGDAFVALVQRYDRRLRGLVGRLVGSDRHRMDDVLQDAYLRAFVALPRFRHDADVGTWLYRITYNTCIEHLRRAANRPEPVDTDDEVWQPVARSSAPDTAAVATDQATRALAALTPDQQATVILVDGQGFDHQAAADILGVAVGTVASRLSRARGEIRRVLSEGS